MSSAYYRFKNKDVKTRVQKIKESLDKTETDAKPNGKFELPSDPGKDPSSPLRQLGITDTFAGVRASNNFTKKKVLGENTMIIPIKQIILEMTGAAANYHTLVPKKSIPVNNPIIPRENASHIEATTKATSLGKPTSNVAAKTIEIKTKEMAKAAAQSNQ